MTGHLVLPQLPPGHNEIGPLLLSHWVNDLTMGGLVLKLKEMAEEILDLLVIGAGPGGSNACSMALSGGLRVAQLERSRFPRIKPCAGGVTFKSRRSLAPELEPELRGTHHNFELNLWTHRTARFSHRRAILHMVVRPEFDNRLVQMNLRQPNFQFFQDEPALEIGYDGLFTVRTERRTLQARQLVGADGAYSLVNRSFQISKPRKLATAVEVNLLHSRAAGRPDQAPCLDFGVLEGGYGWVFPKDDQWSVGLYTLQNGQKGLRRQLCDYIRRKGLRVEGDPLDSFEAHRIPLGGYRLTPPDAPVYLVGDAAGLADAITGEGIYHALESGRLAGQTALEVQRGRGGHRAYYRRLWKSVLPDTVVTYALSRWFYSHLDMGTRGFTASFLWRAFVQGYTQGATFTECLIRSVPLVLRSVREGAGLHRSGPAGHLAEDGGSDGWETGKFICR